MMPVRFFQANDIPYTDRKETLQMFFLKEAVGNTHAQQPQTKCMILHFEKERSQQAL